MRNYIVSCILVSVSRSTTLHIDYQDTFLEDNTPIDSIQYPDGSTFTITNNPRDERDEMILAAIGHTDDIKKHWKHVSEKNNFHHTNLLSHLVAHPTRSENILFVIGNVSDVLHYTHLSSKEKYTLQKNLEQIMSQGFRVLGIGYKEQYHSEINHDDHHGLAWLGAIVMKLKMKKNIDAVSKKLLDEHIPLRIFSEDTLKTSQAILRKAGIQCGMDVCVRGADLRSMPDSDVVSILSHTLLFSELNELDKNRLERLLETYGQHAR